MKFNLISIQGHNTPTRGEIAEPQLQCTLLCSHHSAKSPLVSYRKKKRSRFHFQLELNTPNIKFLIAQNIMEC